MEDIFGQIECRTKSDSMVMRILRSAMDKTHEKLQSRDGPIQFLHNRSMFYELAAILVEGGLTIIQDQTADILEDNGGKVFSDLTEIKDWLYGRIEDMNHLIAEKDIEFADMIENELKLQESLDAKEREILYLQEKLEPGQPKSEDIVMLKSSIDQQVSNIKQRLEDEKRVLNSERRSKRVRVLSHNRSFDLLDNERNGSPVFREDFDSCSPFGIPNQNGLIGKMSSDMDVLKDTLNFAFERMQLQSADAFPLERDVEKLKEERDGLRFQVSLMEDTYLVLLRGIAKNFFSTYGEKKSDENIDFTEIMRFYLESVVQEDLYAIFLHETIKRWKEYSHEISFREDIYQFILIQAAKDFAKDMHSNFWKAEPPKQLDSQKKVLEADDDHDIGRLLREDIFMVFFKALESEKYCLEEHTRKKMKADVVDDSLTQKLDSLSKCSEAEEGLILSSKSKIMEHNVTNNLVMLNSEEMGERHAIELMLKDDASTLNSVGEKLDRALQQVYTRKELLVELEDDYSQLQKNDVSRIESVLENIIRFEGVLDEKLKRKNMRLNVIKREVDKLTEAVALVRKRMLVYKRAFLSRCHNLKLAEIEVDLLGDQVESLLSLLENVYFELNQNATLLSRYFKVHDMLALIQRELTNGRNSCKFKY